MRKLSFLLVLCFLFSFNAKSSHLVGFDLFLTQVTGSKYRATMFFYRDCSGISAPQNIILEFKSASTPLYNFTDTLFKIPVTGIQIMPTCTSVLTSCNGGPTYGVQQWIYEAEMMIPPASDWEISYTMCCRNPSNNLSNSTGSGATTKVFLDNLHAPNNSNPFFITTPPFNVCNGITNNISFAAFDPDGDSLVYRMVTPYDGSGPGSPTYVNYVSPYTYLNPLPSSTAITLDSLTGMMSFTPTQQMVAVLAVEVEEWRDIAGVPTMIGKVRRDIQTNIYNCSSNVPTASGFDFDKNGFQAGDTIYQVHACYGDTLDFNIYGHDIDTAVVTSGDGRLWFDWISPSTQYDTLTVFHEFTDSAYLNVKVLPAHHNGLPYVLRVRVLDQTCPFNLESQYYYVVWLDSLKSADLGPDTSLSYGSQIMLESGINDPLYSHVWQIYTASIPGTNSLLVDSTMYNSGINSIGVQTYTGHPALCYSYDVINLTVLSINMGDLKSAELNVFPVPFGDKIILEGFDSETGIVQYEMFDIKGQKVVVGEYRPQNRVVEIDGLSYLETGTYILKIRIDNKVYSSRVVKW